MIIALCHHLDTEAFTFFSFFSCHRSSITLSRYHCREAKKLSRAQLCKFVRERGLENIYRLKRSLNKNVPASYFLGEHPQCTLYTVYIFCTNFVLCTNHGNILCTHKGGRKNRILYFSHSVNNRKRCFFCSRTNF